jgi:hypothetical protein
LAFLPWLLLGCVERGLACWSHGCWLPGSLSWLLNDDQCRIGGSAARWLLAAAALSGGGLPRGWPPSASPHVCWLLRAIFMIGCLVAAQKFWNREGQPTPCPSSFGLWPASDDLTCTLAHTCPHRVIVHSAAGMMAWQPCIPHIGGGLQPQPPLTVTPLPDCGGSRDAPGPQMYPKWKSGIRSRDHIGNKGTKSAILEKKAAYMATRPYNIILCNIIIVVVITIVMICSCAHGACRMKCKTGCATRRIGV